PADRTYSGKNFAAIMAHWPNEKEHPVIMAEALLRDDASNSEINFPAANYVVEGRQLVAKLHEGNTYRTDLNEFLSEIERLNPLQMKQIKAEIALQSNEQSAPKSLIDMIEAGEERPANVSEEAWKAAERDFKHQMTLENTPEEFYRGERAEDMGDPMSYYSDEELERM
ncbi:hypothetical protein GR268_44875, partial [Rhizobium leguminosarum]|nr:hypothetical protein [Rhizobium leguminosarum]